MKYKVNTNARLCDLMSFGGFAGSGRYCVEYARKHFMVFNFWFGTQEADDIFYINFDEEEEYKRDRERTIKEMLKAGIIMEDKSE